MINDFDRANFKRWAERKRVATVPVCPECKQECEVLTDDHGGTEEVWGAMMWREQLVDVSGCCREEVEFMTPEEYENLEQTI